MFVTLSVNI